MLEHQEWLQLENTKSVLKQIEIEIEELKNAFADGGYSTSESVEKSGILSLKAHQAILTLNQMLDWIKHPDKYRG